MHEGMAIQFTCDPEIDFVRGMIPHHVGAVKMCAILRNSTSPLTLDSFLSQLCTDIEREQQREIKEMTDWLSRKSLSAATCCSGSNTIEHMGMQMGCGLNNCSSTQQFMHENMIMHDGMAIQFTCNAEVDFVRGMIPHHLGAVQMCQVLRDTMSPATLDTFVDHLCIHVKQEQNREIGGMIRWLSNKSLSVNSSCSVTDDDLSCGRGHTLGMDGVCYWTWCWLDERPSLWRWRWDNIPLALFWLSLFIGGPLLKFNVVRPTSFLHRRPLKIVRGSIAQATYMQWISELSYKEIVLVFLFAVSVVAKFVFHYTWFKYMGLTQAAGRALSHTLGLLMGAFSVHASPKLVPNANNANILQVLL